MFPRSLQLFSSSPNTKISISVNYPSDYYNVKIPLEITFNSLQARNN